MNNEKLGSSPLTLLAFRPPMLTLPLLQYLLASDGLLPYRMAVTMKSPVLLISFSLH